MRTLLVAAIVVAVLVAMIGAAMSLVTVTPALVVGWLVAACCYTIGAAKWWVDHRKDGVDVTRRVVGAMLWPLMALLVMYLDDPGVSAEPVTRPDTRAPERASHTSGSASRGARARATVRPMTGAS